MCGLSKERAAALQAAPWSGKSTVTVQARSYLEGIEYRNFAASASSTVTSTNAILLRFSARSAALA